MRSARTHVVATALSLAAPMYTACAQGSVTALATRIDAVRSGRVRLTFATRPGVCGNGNGWSRSRPGNTNDSWGSRDIEVSCEAGPARVVVVRVDGETTEIHTAVGGRWRADTGVTDLGNISAKVAGQWLLNIAEVGPDKPAREALSAIMLTDSLDGAQALLRIARNEKRSSDVRTQAMFWLGEVAGDKATATLDSVAYEAGDREVRKQAIFAMSRRPPEEAVTNLLRMSETLPDRELRKTAIFWLSRSKDPRALAWIAKAVENKE